LHDVARLAATLSAAFHDDPVMRWLIPDADERRAIGPAFFTLFAGAFQRHGHAYRTTDGSGAALWTAPGVASVAEAETPEFNSAIAETCGPATGRGAIVEPLMSEQHPTDPHWYLGFLGVEPVGQGRGTASAMLEHVLTDVDRDRAPAYLEASTSRNRALYERHGFETVGEIELPDGPSLWPMWREPRRR
jgi:ribosomal protein S18 acetylase RimI-like enzyme